MQIKNDVVKRQWGRMQEKMWMDASDFHHENGISKKYWKRKSVLVKYERPLSSLGQNIIDISPREPYIERDIH